jgi:hypothetical protein
VRRYLFVCVLLGCGGEPNQGQVCEATAQVEQGCSNDADEDCDGFTDCLDNECDGQQCGVGDGYTCLAGACLKPGALPPLPRIDNLRVTMHGDTAIIDFEGVAGARDYRVYTLPADEDVLVGEQGEVAIRNAIYRCSGERPRFDREHDAINQFDRSIAGSVRNYMRTEAESTLGYVYLTPGADRVPVYRVADPNLRGGYVWEYASPPAKEYNGADYVVGTEARDALLAQNWRDDGIAFYIPAVGSRPVYRYSKESAVLFYTDGAEANARAGEAGAQIGERFKILSTEETGSVPLRRVFYGWADEHDTLAAGEAQFRSVLHQGAQPVTSVTWPGLMGDTTLVIEALDAGCPFAGAYIGGNAAPESTRYTYAFPTITVDQARLSSGEVFINGQAEMTSRPRPIARGYVNVTPEPHPEMDWFQSFDPMALWEPMEEIIHDGNGNVVLRNSVMSAEFGGTVDDAFSYGPMLGQFYVGSTASVRLVARGASPTLESDSYLHVTMSTPLPSTNRRYPQIWITTTPEVTQAQVPHSYDVPLESRLGPFPFENKPHGEHDTIVVQPFTSNHEMQIQVCNNRGWGVSQQCDRANVYGYHAGHDQPLPWAENIDWTPMPVLGELAGVDRPVKIDVYASTSRVYVLVEGKPAGCAVIPSGQLQAGARNVVFGTSGYHIDIDESVVPDNSPHAYWRRFHTNHVERTFDDLGISRRVARPAWDETRMPCGTHWYGGTTE